jgi:hypothetical protein
METLHLKTVDPDSQELLRTAARLGLELGSERSRRLQPPDGFLRLGLSCPYGCMEGPCRIDPFGNGARRGICGLGSDEMVAAMILRLSLQGALEAMAGDFPLPAPGAFFDAAAARLGGPLSSRDIPEAARLLSRPAATAATLLRTAFRLGLLSLAWTETDEAAPKALPDPCRVGYGLLSGDSPVIGVCGSALPSIDAIVRKLGGGTKFVSLGGWIRHRNGFLPFACTSGEAELALLTGKIGAVLAGSGVDPAVPALCERLGIPIFASGEIDAGTDLPGKASDPYRLSERFKPDPADVREGALLLSEEALKTFSGDGKLALIGGYDSFRQTMGAISCGIVPELLGDGVSVAGWGDAGLWMIKEGLGRRVRLIDPNRGPIGVLKALHAAGKRDLLSGICFTALRGCADLAAALGLSALGADVLIPLPLPIWGSAPARKEIDTLLSELGGSLRHFDHPATPSEILEWVRAE